MRSAAGLVDRLFKGEKVSAITPTVPTPADHSVMISQQQLDKWNLKLPPAYANCPDMRGEVTAEDKAALRIAGVSKIFNRGTLDRTACAERCRPVACRKAISRS